MGDEGKKISFGFSKLSKKTSVIRTKNVKEEEKVQFVDCVEEKSIKIINEEKKEEKILVIPLNSNKVSENNSKFTRNSAGVKTNVAEKVTAAETSTIEPCIHTLDSLAAKEILEELNNKTSKEENPKIFAVPLTTNAPLGEKESSLDDYENIPVSEYGLAMLRGMGWSPGEGVGKNAKVVTSLAPALRPKGMGLGADKVIKTAPKTPANNDNEELKLVKGAFVRIIAGSHKDSYGQIEGFDEESGRLFVKLSLKNIVASFNEFMVQLVTKHDFEKNSKVINVKKFEEYKNKETENKINAHFTRSPSVKNNRHNPNSPQQKRLGSSDIKEVVNLEKDLADRSNKKHSKKLHKERSNSYVSPPRQSSYSNSRKSSSKSYKDQNSSDESPPQQRRNRSRGREYNSSGKSRTPCKNRSSSDESPILQRSNSPDKESKNRKSRKDQSSSDESPARRRRSRSQSREHSRNKKSHRHRKTSGDSPPRQRRKHSHCRENRSDSRSKNNNSDRNRKKKSRSRSPRRKY